MAIQIIKSTGERAPFSERKLRASLERTGAKQPMVDHIIDNVKKQLRDGLTTKELYRIVLRELRKEASHIAHRYHLRSGLLRLGPAGFKFEKYVASILSAYGYKAHLPKNDLEGLCVRHEVDVVATKDGKRIMIEAKFRNRFSDVVNLKDTLATYARFLDLREGAKAGLDAGFDEVWIVTNGRFSDRAEQFGACKDMQMIGWNHPTRSLARMVDHASLYPITVLESLKSWELDALASQDLMLCRDIANADVGKLAGRTRMERRRVEKMVDTCKRIVSG